MKKKFTLLFVFILGLLSALNAQTALDPGQFVNGQITGPGTYTVEPGQFYAFDGRIDLTFEITIEGSNDSWIYEATNPPVLLNSPAADGAPRDFFEIKEGGGLTVKNVLFSGTNSNGEVGKVIAANTAGNHMVIDNCVITDWQDFAFRNQNMGQLLSVTNCVFINGMRPRYSQWGGFPVRMDVACDEVVFENNTVVNSGRLLANSGPFHNANVLQIHNTYLNQAVGGEEQRANEFITANNIFYNYHMLGRRTEAHTNPDNAYGAYFTTWNYFADAKENLEEISLYLGQNLFYRPDEIVDWFDTFSGDSLALSYLWEKPDVDSFVVMDNNYTIGANYAEINPGFATLPGNISAIVGYVDGNYNNPSGDWSDWRIESPVSFAMDGTPSLSWPPAFDLTYSHSGLQTAGTDGLPLGDLNWFPDEKADYLANKDAYIADIRDSMINAVHVYMPDLMNPYMISTPLITDISTSVFNQEVPSGFFMSGNEPNPFDQSTTIRFGLHDQAQVTLSVYSILGQKVFESTEERLLSGSNQINFDASNLNSGIYIYKITATDSTGKTYALGKEMVVTK